MAEKRSEMCSAFMKELRFAYTQELCLEAWKRSHMGCSALLCGRLADSQESRFQASKRSNMGSAVPEVGRSADFQEFCFDAAKRSDMNCVELQRCLFVNYQALLFRSRILQIFAVPSCKRFVLLMLTNSGFRVRNVEIWAVLMKLIC